jgi:phage FluMu protein Com
LLAKVEGEAKVEIKCPRCKTMNLYSEEIFITIEKKRREATCTDPEVAGS